MHKRNRWPCAWLDNKHGIKSHCVCAALHSRELSSTPPPLPAFPRLQSISRGQHNRHKQHALSVQVLRQRMPAEPEGCRGRDRGREVETERDRETWAHLSYLHTQLKTSSTLITFKWTSKCRQQLTNWLTDCVGAVCALWAWQKALRRCWCCLRVSFSFLLSNRFCTAHGSGSVIFELLFV